MDMMFQVVDAASVLCRCGNVGCLEALAGGAALSRDGEALANSGRSERLRIALEQHGRVTAEDVAATVEARGVGAVERAEGAGVAASLAVRRKDEAWLVGPKLHWTLV